MDELALPARYQAIACLGRGGGGQVWAVLDRYNGLRCALKVLSADATQREMEALVREATALSGLEGLGVPRVLAFGRLPETGKPFLVRELIEGQSLEEFMQARGPLPALLDALAKAAEQLTVLHRSGLLHGDVKPANIIVQPSGRATLVDLGLAAPWQEHGVRPEGLTPRYAAPELFAGGPLSVRAEVYALGVTLSEALEYGLRPAAFEACAGDLEAVAQRAIAPLPADRYPSADEFASALRRAAKLATDSGHAGPATLWPITGIDAASENLRTLAQGLAPNEALCILGAPGSGRSALLRRLAWSLGLFGVPLTFIDDPAAFSETSSFEVGSWVTAEAPFVLVDDVENLDEERLLELRRVRNEGGRLVVVGGAQLFPDAKKFVVPGLDAAASRDLVRRAVPSLSERHLARIVEASAGRPGDLRAIVDRIARQAVASAEDIEAVIALGSRPSLAPDAPLARARFMLDKGRFNEAAAALSVAHILTADEKLTLAILQARLDIGRGEAVHAVSGLRAVAALAKSTQQRTLAAECKLYLARALIGAGEHTEAVALATTLETDDRTLLAEGRAFEGLARLLLNQGKEAETVLADAVEQARQAGSARVEAIALCSLALSAQRGEQLERAKEIYERAVLTAEQAGDAGMLAALQLNLAGLAKVQGDMAQAIERYESAVDMGRRSGHRSAVRLALLNLANLDLYLGRLAKARSSIESLEQQREQLPAETRAQLLGLQAELLQKHNEFEGSVSAYEACAAAYDMLGRSIDAAEARLEGILAAARLAHVDVASLRQRLEQARVELRNSTAHKPLFHLAEARIHTFAKDEFHARASLDEALSNSRETGQREWVWRALQIRASLEEEGGQGVRARRDWEEALSVLEDIAARLPRDLREVYWNDGRRRDLRTKVQSTLAGAVTEYRLGEGSASGVPRRLSASTSSSISEVSGTPLEHRLARILEVNHELVGVWDLERLTARIIDSAVTLLRAEGGAVVLKRGDGGVQLYTSRVAHGDGALLEFSRSIAERVIASGEPVVSLSARDDARMKSYASVHQMRLQSVACVPIREPGGGAIGALYLETRLRPGAHFEAELPTLSAFADQMAIALENARLINENRARADDLERANQDLRETQGQLSELLQERTVKLKQARRKLRDVRDTLYGHFGYQGLVGTSAAMRKVYALIERVKDTDVPVLITGESGTGKEVVARAIHNASPRANAKFLGVNCGAIPENLLESELFGHVRGAFTGADRERKGLFREAEHGTLLLDEIGEMPHKMQAGLLRVLQERTVRSVGGQAEEPVNVRVLCATNRDLEELVQRGTFREDLYYRIHVVNLHVPALRERIEDIPQLVDHFLGIFGARYKREKKSIAREALRHLESYHWPGNVRQLEHLLLNAWVMSDEDELVPEDFVLPSIRQSEARAVSLPKPSALPSENPATPERGVAQAEAEPSAGERERFLQALRSSNWNRVKAAELMGIPRRTFYRRLRDHGIQ